MRPFRLSLLAASAAALTAACGGGSDGNARITVKLTDAAAQLNAAVVTITQVSLHGSDKPVILSSAKTTTDLLTLANKTADLVTDVVVPAAKYTELRFRITGGYIAVPNASGGSDIYASSPSYEGLPAGATVKGSLQMPSFAESGLKVDISSNDLELKTGTKVLLVDFDVAQSFGHQAGQSGMWVMQPVIKGADITFSGNAHATIKLGNNVSLPIVGGSQANLGQFKAVLKNAAGSPKELVFTAKGGGIFGASFLFLLPGAYTVDVVAPANVTFATTPARPLSVTVNQGVDANADFTVTSASSP